MQTLTVYNQHVLQALKQIPDNSIDCIVTSPPYYGLRSYKGTETDWNGWFGQLGLEPTYQMYLEHLLMVTAELKRVLKPSGTLFWNMGDSYAGNMGKRQGWNDNKISYTREEALKNGTTFYLSADYGNIQDKSLMMIPERFAIGMIDQGWILRNSLIWHKLNHLPSPVKDRLSNAYEFVFFFVKNRKYYFDLNAIKEKNKVVGITDMRPAGVLRQRLYKNSSYNKSDDPHLSQFKSSKQETNQNVTGSIYKNPGDVWSLTTAPMPKKLRDMPNSHFAVFPPVLPRRCIKAGCPQNGVVLDPFAGSGTTLQVALELGLDAIGIEISKDYIPLIERRTHAKERQILGTLDYRLIK